MPRQETIVLVPGMRNVERGAFQKKFLQGMERYISQRGMQWKQEPSGASGASYVICSISSAADGIEEPRTLHVEEAFWGDLIDNLSDKSPIKKFTEGLAVLAFWLLSPASWNVLKSSNRYIISSSIISALILVFWYYGIVSVTLVAIGSNNDSSILFVQLPEPLRDSLANFGATLGSWQVWALVSAIMALLPVSSVVNYAYAAKHHLQNKNNVSDDAQMRLTDLLNALIRGGAEQITVVGYSFGTVVAVQALAGYNSGIQHNPCSSIRLITLGSPITVFSSRSPALRTAVDEIVINPRVHSWLDFYSEQDWMCSQIQISSDKTSEKLKFKDVHLRFSEHILDAMRGSNHTAYLSCKTVFQQILEP